MSKIVPAYRTDTGQKVRVPEHWIGHPKLGPNLSKTPRQKAAEKAATSGATKAAEAADKKE